MSPRARVVQVVAELVDEHAVADLERRAPSTRTGCRRPGTRSRGRRSRTPTATTMMTPHSDEVAACGRRRSLGGAGAGSGSERSARPGAMGSPPASSTFTRCILSRLAGAAPRTQTGSSESHSSAGSRARIDSACRSGRHRSARLVVAGADPCGGARGRSSRHSRAGRPRRPRGPTCSRIRSSHAVSLTGTTMRWRPSASSSTDSAGALSVTQLAPRGSSSVTRGSSGRGWYTAAPAVGRAGANVSSVGRHRADAVDAEHAGLVAELAVRVGVPLPQREERRSRIDPAGRRARRGRCSSTRSRSAGRRAAASRTASRCGGARTRRRPRTRRARLRACRSRSRAGRSGSDRAPRAACGRRRAARDPRPR